MKTIETELATILTAILIAVSIEILLHLWSIWSTRKSLKIREELHPESASWREPCGICKTEGLPGQAWGSRVLSPDTFERLTQPQLNAKGDGYLITPNQALWRRSGRGKRYTVCQACGRYHRVMKKSKRRGKSQ